MPAFQSDEAQFLTQDQFNDAADQWMSLLESGDNDVLQACFKTAAGPAACALFAGTDVVRLVSAISVATIKVRFVLLPREPVASFGIVLFGADADGKRLTTYLASPAVVVPPTAAGSQVASDALTGVVSDTQLPDSLAATWLSKWAAYGKLKTQLFLFEDDFLRGYTFKAADFVDTLFDTGNDQTAQVQVQFALHERYAPDALTTADVTSTFGLAVNLMKESGEAGSDVFFDFSMPCPPTC